MRCARRCASRGRSPHDCVRYAATEDFVGVVVGETYFVGNHPAVDRGLLTDPDEPSQKSAWAIRVAPSHQEIAFDSLGVSPPSKTILSSATNVKWLLPSGAAQKVNRARSPARQTGLRKTTMTESRLSSVTWLRLQFSYVEPIVPSINMIGSVLLFCLGTVSPPFRGHPLWVPWRMCRVRARRPARKAEASVNLRGDLRGGSPHSARGLTLRSVEDRGQLDLGTRREVSLSPCTRHQVIPRKIA